MKRRKIAHVFFLLSLPPRRKGTEDTDSCIQEEGIQVRY